MSESFPPIVQAKSFPPMVIPILLCRDEETEKIPIFSHPDFYIQDIFIPKNLNVRLPMMSRIFDNSDGSSLFEEYTSITTVNIQLRNNLKDIMKLTIFSVEETTDSSLDIIMNPLSPLLRKWLVS